MPTNDVNVTFGGEFVFSLKIKILFRGAVKIAMHKYYC